MGSQMTDKKNAAAERGGVLCVGLLVLDIAVGPVEAPSQWKEKQGVDRIELIPGGDAANQSIHLAGLGHHTILCASCGNDTNGAAICETLRGSGVDCSAVRFREDIPTGTALILVSNEGERRIFSMKGAHGTLCKEDLPDAIPEDCAAISLGSLFSMPLLEKDGLEDLLREAKKKGILVFADLDSGKVVPAFDVIGPLLPYIDYLIPSEYDLRPLTQKGTPEEAVAVLQGYGTKHIIVKCGEKGARIFSPDFEGTIPAVPVHAVDTTGAGDCMSAAFISRILHGDDIASACAYACAAGSYSTLFSGASGVQVTDESVRAFMAEHHLDKM